MQFRRVESGDGPYQFPCSRGSDAGNPQGLCRVVAYPYREGFCSGNSINILAKGTRSRGKSLFPNLGESCDRTGQLCEDKEKAAMLCCSCNSVEPVAQPGDRADIAGRGSWTDGAR